MGYQPINLKLHHLALRIGGQVAVLFSATGILLCARLLPAPAPTASAEDIAQRFADNQAGIQVGVTLMLIGFSSWALWGGSVAAWARSVEKGAPILTYTMIICGAVAEMVVIMIAFFWALAAFRPGEIDPEITQMLNDGAWLLFLIPWAPFSVWAIIFSLLVLQDDSEDPIFPRWLAGLSFGFALILVPAFAPLLFKDGGFAYDSVLGMVVPLIAFEGWKASVSIAMMHGVEKQLKTQKVDEATLA